MELLHPQNEIQRRARRRRRQAGMTLIEIMIVIVIFSIVAGGVGFAALKQLEKAKVNTTQAAIFTIKSATALFIAQNNAECATVADLIEDGQLDSSQSTTDGWDNEFQIECDGTDITVTSAGPDKEMGTEDDISNETGEAEG